MNSSLFTKAWFVQNLARLVKENNLNFLDDFEGVSIFDTPIIGVADGDDELFVKFRTAVSPHHIIPRNFLNRQSPPDIDLSNVRVISWALPFTDKVRHSNRNGNWPSRLYSAARNNGETLIHEIICQLTRILQEHGIQAMSPVFTEEYNTFRSQDVTFTSTWSERHVAYATGLGYFGLNGCLITPVGAHVRFGSIITNLSLEPSPLKKSDYRAPCLEYRGKSCIRCIKRCPVNAISEEGLDKAKCYARKKSIEARFMKEYTGTMTLFPHSIVKSGKRAQGYSLGCALCQVDVPCESIYPDFRFKEGGV